MFLADSVQVQHIPRGGLPTLTQLLASGAPRVALALIAIGGLVWVVAYVAAIRTGHRDKTYAIPLVAICLNVTWEAVHSLVLPPSRSIDRYTNLAWLLVDLIVLIQAFRYGRGMQAATLVRKHFPAVILGTLVLAFIGHITFQQQLVSNSIFPDDGGALAAFLINLVMSVLFVGMYFSRPDGAGLSKTVAWAKMLGTLLYSVGNVMILQRIPNVQYEVQIRPMGTTDWTAAGTIGTSTLHPGLTYFLAVAITLFDIIYIILLYRGPRGAARQPVSP